MGEQYRVVRANGEIVYPGTDDLDEALRCARHYDGRLQRVSYEDVPEPEPLPDLPREVWAIAWHGVVDLHERNPRPLTASHRLFHCAIPPDFWVEVTE